MNVSLEPLESNVRISVDDGLRVDLRVESPVQERRPSEEFEETIARVRQSILKHSPKWKPLQWTPSARPELSVHPVLMKLFDMAWNAHVAREELILTAFASTLDMKVRNTEALSVYGHSLDESAKQLLAKLSKANMAFMHNEWKSKWASTIRTAQDELATIESNPEVLLEMYAAAHLSAINCDSTGADLKALEIVAPTFRKTHEALHKQWKLEMERHAATLSGKLLQRGIEITLPVREKVETTLESPVSSGKEWVDTLRACHLDFALRVQALDAVDAALEENLSISGEIARAALEITQKEDESFRAAKAVVNASIGKVDETISHVEKELARAYNQTTDYKRHLVVMRSTIEMNLDKQREVLYRSALAMIQ
jgi:hypothetical protein